MLQRVSGKPGLACGGWWWGQGLLQVLPANADCWQCGLLGLRFGGGCRTLFSMKHIQAALVVCTVAGWLLGGAPAEALGGEGPYLMAWGMNGDEQAVPVATNLLEGVSAFSAGWYHNLAVKDGRVWAWGNNTNGQCTVPVLAQSEVVDVAAGQSFSLARRDSGLLILWGGSGISALSNIPSKVATSATKIAAGAWHALALTGDGEVVAWGSNTYGQCTVPAELSNGVSEISAGLHYSMALKDGAVHVFGIPGSQSEAYGIRDVPEAASNDVVAISAGAYHALALKADGTVVSWGAEDFIGDDDEGIDYLPEEAASDVEAISAGYLFSMALKTDGNLVVWGATENDQTPVPAYAENGLTGISAGFGHCLVMSAVMPPRFVGTALPFAYTNQPYSTAVPVIAKPAASFYPAGNWSWMSLSETGQITGTPTETGAYSVTMVASNEFGQRTNTYVVQVFTAQQVLPVFITTSPLLGGTVNVPYEVQFEATGGPTFSWQNAGSGFPPGLELSEEGVLSGTPSGTFNSYFLVLASNIVGVTTNPFTLSVTNPLPPAFETDVLPDGYVGEDYEEQVVVSQHPDVIELFGGALPDGLVLEEDGWIMGTPERAGLYEFELQAGNISGVTNRSFEIMIFGPPYFVSTSPLPFGAVGESYTFELDAPYAEEFSLVGGALPPGVSMDEDGVLTGAPTADGSFEFTVRATNEYGYADAEFELRVGNLPVFTTVSPLTDGRLEVPYELVIVATGADSFGLQLGALPPGLLLAADGTLEGTPTTVGNYVFTVQAFNDYGWSAKEFDLGILGRASPRITAVGMSNGVFHLGWTNLHPVGRVELWQATDIREGGEDWTNQGVPELSPWTTNNPPSPSYYRLRLIDPP